MGYIPSEIGGCTSIMEQLQAVTLRGIADPSCSRTNKIHQITKENHLNQSNSLNQIEHQDIEKKKDG
jgi:hypothetical protein